MSQKYSAENIESLSDILRKRRDFYCSLFNRVLQQIYTSANVGDIEQFEIKLLGFCKRIVGDDLERLINNIETDSQQQHDAKKEDKRPLLTLYQYAKARNEGMSLEEIKKKFRIRSLKQLGPFARYYKRIQSQKSELPPQ